MMKMMKKNTTMTTTETLDKILAPLPGRVLDLSEHHSEEGITPGMKMIAPSRPGGQCIMLNATYNNYTITNHYRSKAQIDENEKLRKENKRIQEALSDVNRKYKASKHIIEKILPLLNSVDISRLDTQSLCDLNILQDKWCELKRKSTCTSSSSRSSSPMSEERECNYDNIEHVKKKSRIL